jgi:hypothetical protein
MASTVSFLEAQRTYVARLVREMDPIMAMLGRPQSTPLGGFPTATSLYAQHRAVWDGVRAALQATRDQLDDAVAGTRRILDNYRSTEDRDHASVEDVTRLLAPAVSPAAVSPAPVRDAAGSTGGAAVPAPGDSARGAW